MVLELMGRPPGMFVIITCQGFSFLGYTERYVFRTEFSIQEAERAYGIAAGILGGSGSEKLHICTDEVIRLSMEHPIRAVFSDRAWSSFTMQTQKDIVTQNIEPRYREYWIS